MLQKEKTLRPFRPKQPFSRKQQNLSQVQNNSFPYGRNSPPCDKSHSSESNNNNENKSKIKGFVQSHETSWYKCNLL